jgi:hypothetical protein
MLPADHSLLVPDFNLYGLGFDLFCLWQRYGQDTIRKVGLDFIRDDI